MIARTFVIAALVGAGSCPQADAPPGVAGTIALRSPSGEPISSAAVQIVFIPERQMEPFVRAKITEARVELEQLEATRAERQADAERWIAENTRANQQLQKTAAAVLARRLELQRRPPARVDEMQSLQRQLTEEAATARRRATESRQRAIAAQREGGLVDQQVSRVTGGAFFLSGLPAAAQTSTTRADGSFSAPLEPGRYAAVATLLSPAGQRYAWLVWTQVEKGVTPLRLNNDNLHGSDCEECVVRQAD